MVSWSGAAQYMLKVDLRPGSSNLVQWHGVYITNIAIGVNAMALSEVQYWTP